MVSTFSVLFSEKTLEKISPANSIAQFQDSSSMRMQNEKNKTDSRCLPCSNESN